MKLKLRAIHATNLLPAAIVALQSTYAGSSFAQTTPSTAPPAAATTPGAMPPAATTVPTPAEPSPTTPASTTAAANADGSAPAIAVAATAAPAAEMPAPPAPVVPPPPPPEQDAYKKINMDFWLRVAGVDQNPVRRNRLDRLSSNGEVEAHFNNRMRKWLQWTADFVGTYGGGSIDGAGQFAILDLIAQLEPDEAFNVWAGRMLVPSDRANFAGPYFMAPWNYPGAFGAGPKEGPFGRNDGATIWGQFGGGTFKYYAGVYNLYGAQRTNGQFTAPLFSGRLNLSLLSPEPGFYHNATYYGKDILAIGIGAQYQKNGTAAPAGTGGPDADYSLFNADILFEKTLGEAGVVDLEGALYKYFGDNEARQASYFALASYLTPDIGGIGKFQPLVRLQQTMYKDVAGTSPDSATAVDVQLGYIVESFATRFAVGFQHAKASSGNIDNQIFAGIQLMK